MNRRCALLAAAAALLLLLSPPAARADDGALAFGGTPALLSRHPQVSMLRERVTMTVQTSVVNVDCRFVFHNAGPATTVRMGFPDEGEGASDPEEEYGANWASKPPKSTFHWFHSYVNGQPAATKLIHSNSPSLAWHEKIVFFPANADVQVRDLYAVDVGAQIMMSNQTALEASYALHTGGSWHGPIGQVVVIVRFHTPAVKTPIQAMRMRRPSDPAVWEKSWAGYPRRVWYMAPADAQVTGPATLRFTLRNWRPGPKDDIYLAFGEGRPISER